MGKTAIEWSDMSWNPVRMRHTAAGPLGHYCQKISPGCQACFASRMQWRFGGGEYDNVSGNALMFAQAMVEAGTIFLDHKELAQPRDWRKPRIIFPCSMTDMFGEWVPFDWIVQIWIQMQANQRHKFLILTKRPDRLRAFASAYPRLFDPPLPNVWLGVSVENQDYAWRVRKLAQVPAAVHWASIEPLLGPVDPPIFKQCRICNGASLVRDSQGSHLCRCAERGYPGNERQLDWVVVGGLSGGDPAQRLVVPCTCTRLHGTYCYYAPRNGGTTHYAPNLNGRKWVSDILAACQYAGVPAFFKQWGGPTSKSGGHIWLDGPIPKTVRQYPDGHGGMTTYAGVLGQPEGVLQPALV